MTERVAIRVSFIVGDLVCICAVQEERIKKKEQKRAENAQQRRVSGSVYVLILFLAWLYICLVTA